VEDKCYSFIFLVFFFCSFLSHESYIFNGKYLKKNTREDRSENVGKLRDGISQVENECFGLEPRSNFFFFFLNVFFLIVTIIIILMINIRI
jgi:uncharacterized membrane protein SpoIIM required for sporulation